MPDTSERCRSFWYVGLTCDHLYPDCPNMKRGEAELRRAGWWQAELSEAEHMAKWNPFADPHGTDVCGMCLHRHNRTVHPKAKEAA